MAEPYPTTDIHLVPDLTTALEVAQELDAEAVGLDMEGVLGNYVGNTPYKGSYEDFTHGQGRENMSHMAAVILDRPEVAFGVVTNNTNMPGANAEESGLLVTRVAHTLEIPFVHKGMRVRDVELRGKPSGDLSEYFCKIVGVDPAHAVLVDDQGVKNTGDAVKAGMKAIIVPNPIGLPRADGKVEEHPWVRRSRILEPRIYASLERGGWMARVAYSRIAGIDPDLVGALHDHR